MIRHFRKLLLILSIATTVGMNVQCGTSVSLPFVPEDATIQFNTQSDAPLAAILSSPNGTAMIYGQKDTEGVITHADSLILTVPDGSTHSMTFDTMNRPTLVADSLGNSAVFTYDDDTILIEYTSPSGGKGTATIDVGDIPDWPPTLAKPKLFDKPIVGVDDGKGWSLINVVTHVRKISNGQPVGVVDDASVFGLVSNYSRPFAAPAPFKIAGPYKDAYAFEFLYFSEPVPTAGLTICEFVKDTAGRVVQHTGAGLALIAAVCGLTGLAGPEGPVICVWVASEAGLLTSAGLGLTGSALAEDWIGPNCDDYEQPADPETATIRVDVRLPSQYSVNFLQDQKLVNLRNLGSPPVVDFTFDVNIDNVSCNPDEPYEIRQWSNGDFTTEEDGGRPEICVSADFDQRTPTFSWSPSEVPDVIGIALQENGVPSALWAVDVQCVSCGDTILPPVTYSTLPPNTTYRAEGSVFLEPGKRYSVEVFAKTGGVRELGFQLK